MRNGKKHRKQLPVGDLRGIERHLYRFRMTSAARTHNFVVSRGFGSATETRHGVCNTLQVLENRFHAPETTAREHRCLWCRILGRGNVNSSRRKWLGTAGLEKKGRTKRKQ